MTASAPAARYPRVAALGLGWFPDRAGGLDRYVRDLVTGLDTSCEAVVIGPATDAPANVTAVSDHRAPLLRRLLDYAVAARGVAARADVVDAHFALYAAAALSSSRVRARPLVVHFHGPWAREARAEATDPARLTVDLRYALRRRVERSVLQRATRVVAVSHAFARLAHEHTGVPLHRVDVIPPSVDLARFTPGDRREARRALGLPDDAWVVVAARRLVRRTGVDVLLRAWDRVRADGRSGSGVLVVAGDGPLRLALERAAGDDESVRFLGALTDDELVSLYRAADVSVVPSRSLEGFGLVVLESLACGTPVVVSDVGGLPEAVAGLDADLVVRADDADALADRLVAARTGAAPFPDSAACRTYAEGFSPTALVRRHRELYAAVTDASRRRLHVAVLGHTAALGGGEIAMARLVDALVRGEGSDGADVTAVCFEDGAWCVRMRDAGADVSVLPLDARAATLSRVDVVPGRVPIEAIVASVRQVGLLARRLRSDRPDLVHANSLKAGVIGGLAARAAGVPMVWHVRDRIADDYLPAATARALRWWIPRVATAVIVNSETTRQALGAAGSKAIVVRDPYRASDAARSETLTDRTLTPAGDTDVLRVGMVGRIAPWKGQHVFLDGFARAFPQGGAQAVIVGAALFGEDDYAASLPTRAATLGIAERVELTGFVDDVSAVLDTLDVFVHASVLPEPHGQVVVEAMAAGIPVVASRAGGPAEICTDGVDALLVEPGDPDALARALRRLAAAPDLRAQLGAAGRTRAASFEPAAVVPAVLAVYRDVVDRHAR